MSTTTTTLSCGCRLTWRRGVPHFYPCSEVHSNVAAYVRQPGSEMVVHSVKRSKS